MSAVNRNKPYKRFMAAKAADTGVDPSANWRHFIKQESTIDQYRGDRMGTMARKSVEFTPVKGAVPIGTTKCTFKLGLDSEAKLTRNGKSMEPRVFPKNPTDHISQDPPPTKRPF